MLSKILKDLNNYIFSMIKSKKDLIYYLACDAIALHRNYDKPRFIHDNIWKYQILMRRCAYYKNCKSGFYSKLFFKILKIRYTLLGQFLGFSIPFNAFGPGLCIEHYGSIVVNEAAMIGANCRIHEGTTIGANGLFSYKAPSLGNNCYIATGAKIIGDITISDGTVIGANAVVTKSFIESNISIGGVPARKLSDKNSDEHIIKATEII
jgi:serine O-acetyltransferase